MSFESFEASNGLHLRATGSSELELPTKLRSGLPQSVRPAGRFNLPPEFGNNATFSTLIAPRVSKVLK
jgi:hypothetical protein